MASIFDAINTIFNTVVDWAEDNPIATSLITGAIAGIAAPDQMDIMKKKQELELEKERMDRERQNKNLDVGSIKLSKSESGNYLAANQTPVNPMDIINQPGILRRAYR